MRRNWLLLAVLALLLASCAGESYPRVIAKLGPFGIPPVVVHLDLDPVLKAQLRAALLDMADDPRGQAVLDALMMDRFVVVNDSIYTSIRQMASALRGWNVSP